MEGKNNAKCIICGKGYYKCISCKDLVRLKPWQRYTDTSEHYKIYQILNGHYTGVYSTKEAKEKLQLVDLTDIDTFNENIKEGIKKILAYKEPIMNTPTSIEDEDENSLDSNIEVKDDLVKSKSTRKRKVN